MIKADLFLSLICDLSREPLGIKHAILVESRYPCPTATRILKRNGKDGLTSLRMLVTMGERLRIITVLADLLSLEEKSNPDENIKGTTLG
jgi:hypothetical protein